MITPKQAPGSGSTTLFPNSASVPPTLDGTSGSDTIVLNQGQTLAYAGGVRLKEGNDFLTGSQDAERIYGGKGADGIIGSGGNDTINAGRGPDRIFAQDGNDIILGFGGNDFLSGEFGNDSIAGGQGADSLFGGGGADRLKGDFGPDQLTGGTEGDLFVLDPRTDATNDLTQIDLITDFNQGEGDKIAVPVGTGLDPNSFNPSIDVNGDTVPDFVIRLINQQILGVAINNPGIKGPLTFNSDFFFYSNVI